MRGAPVPVPGRNPDMAKLLPCPFCGRLPQKSAQTSDHTTTGEAWFVSCNCGGYARTAHQFGDTEAAVTLAWNRRVPSTPWATRAVAIVHGILADLKSRAGFRQEWEQTDTDIQLQILEDWGDIVAAHVSAP